MTIANARARARARALNLAVTECAPAVADVDALLTQLNASNDFGTFVQQMRRRFRDIALA